MLQSQELDQAGNQPAEDEARIVMLAISAAEGDEYAFADLYSLLSQRVFNLVLRSVHDRPTAEDICQEIWLRVHAEIRNLRAPEALRSWLYRIASRACVDFARSSRGKHRNDESDIDEFIVAYGPQPEDSAILGSEVRMVWETLGSMAPRQSMALYLRQVEGLSYDEIASVLECTRPTVEALLFRARQSFIRAYHRVESSPAERCEMFSQVMASVIDNEPTVLQRSALESHATDCSGCRMQLAEVRRVNRAYLALPLLPIGKGLALEVILTGGGAAAGGGLISAAAGLLGAGAFQAKVVLIGALIATAGGAAIATDQIDVPLVSEFTISRDTEDPNRLTIAGPEDSGGSGVNAEDVLIAQADRISALLTGTPFTSTGPGAPAQATGASPVPTTPPDEPIPSTTNGDTPTPGDREGEGATSAPSPPAPDSPAPPSEAPPGSLEELTAGLTTLATDTIEDVVVVAGEVVEDVLVVAGDTVNDFVEPVTAAIEPVDTVVEDLTGLSVNETLADVTNALPSSDGTPVPLDETVEDVVEPVGDLLEDPLQPVEDILEDPVGTVDDVTGPLLDPLLPGSTPEAGTTPEPTSEPEPATEPEDPCLLGLLFC